MGAATDLAECGGGWPLRNQLPGPELADVFQGEDFAANHPVALVDLDDPYPGQPFDWFVENPADHLGSLLHHPALLFWGSRTLDQVNINERHKASMARVDGTNKARRPLGLLLE